MMFDAARLDLRGLRVLVLVDHVLVGRLGHQLAGGRRHPGGHERREVQPRAAVEQQLVGDQLVGDLAADAVFREPVARDEPVRVVDRRRDR